MIRKFPALVFVAVLLIYTLYPGVEAVRPTGASAGLAAADMAAEDDVVDFAPPSGADAADLAGGASDVVVRYTDPAEHAPTPTPTATPIPTPAATPIVKGMSGADVSILQQQLLVWGFMMDKPDGVYGSATEDAVKELQTYLSAAEAASSPSVTFEEEVVFGDEPVQALSAEVAEPTPAPSPSPTPAPAYPATGEVDAKLMAVIDEGFPLYRETITVGSQGLEAKRVQRRLESLNYLYKGVDGAFGQRTADGLAYFQKLNGIPQTAIADRVTQELLFSGQAKEADRPYHQYSITVDISEQRLYVYAWSNGGYKKLVKKVKCTTGLPKTPTPLGFYQETTGPGNRWHYFKKFGVWAQYAFYIEGDIMIHSVIFKQQGGKPTSGSVRSLGKRASHGCVRVSVSDAKWVYENCSVGTPVTVQK